MRRRGGMQRCEIKRGVRPLESLRRPLGQAAVRLPKDGSASRGSRWVRCARGSLGREADGRRRGQGARGVSRVQAESRSNLALLSTVDKGREGVKARSTETGLRCWHQSAMANPRFELDVYIYRSRLTPRFICSALNCVVILLSAPTRFIPPIWRVGDQVIGGRHAATPHTLHLRTGLRCVCLVSLQFLRSALHHHLRSVAHQPPPFFSFFSARYYYL
jgi:hypothetical protein